MLGVGVEKGGSSSSSSSSATRGEGTAMNGIGMHTDCDSGDILRKRAGPPV